MQTRVSLTAIHSVTEGGTTTLYNSLEVFSDNLLIGGNSGGVVEVNQNHCRSLDNVWGRVAAEPGYPKPQTVKPGSPTSV